MVDEKLLQKILFLQNPWWKNKKVPAVYLGKKRQDFYKKIRRFLNVRQIILIYGLRRIGKTTFLYQLIQEFIDKGVSSKNIIYFSFDEKITSLRELLDIYENAVLKNTITENTRLYLFFDEIQKLPDWQNQVKLVYDLFPKIKIFLSGSASINLQKGVRESLAGRVFEFEFPPLSFKEFLTWKNFDIQSILKNKNLNLYEKDLKNLAKEYIFKGGFPEIVNEKNSEIVRMYLKSSVLYKIIEQDLPIQFGLKDTEFLKALVEYFFSQPGTILSYNSLTSHFGRNKITVMNYIYYLKYALLLREVKNYRPNMHIASRKGKKIYPYNPAFCSIYSLEADSFTNSLETAVAYALNASYYYRNSFEVDFLLKHNNKLVPVEVKAGQPETRQIKRFLDKFKLKTVQKGYVITENYEGKEGSIEILPFWKLLLKGLSL